MEIKQPREIKTLHSLSLVFTHRTSVTIEMMIKILFCSNYWHSLDINSSLLSSRCMINFTARPYSLIVSSGMHIRKNQSVLETNELYRSLDLMEQKVDPLVAVSHWGCKSLCELGEVDNRARDAPLFIYRSFPQLAELPKLISCCPISTENCLRKEPSPIQEGKQVLVTFQNHCVLHCGLLQIMSLVTLWLVIKCGHQNLEGLRHSPRAATVSLALS